MTAAEEECLLYRRQDAFSPRDVMQHESKQIYSSDEKFMLSLVIRITQNMLPATLPKAFNTYNTGFEFKGSLLLNFCSAADEKS